MHTHSRILTTLLLLAVFGLSPQGPLAAEEDAPPAAPAWPETVKVQALDDIPALPVDTQAVALGYRKGMLQALADRCPDVVRVEIEEGSQILWKDLVHLRRLKRLAFLSVWGDTSFPDTHFRLVGELRTLRRLDFGLA